LIYRASAAFPQHEIYGLTSQIRRAAVSVPSNIAEGAGRITKGEFIQSIGHARGSLLEIETQLIVAQRLGYLDSKETGCAVSGDKRGWQTIQRPDPLAKANSLEINPRGATFISSLATAERLSDTGNSPIPTGNWQLTLQLENSDSADEHDQTVNQSG
jgi:four helix bundle protein